MAELINLNKARKAKQRDARKTQAQENRIKFGRSRSETAATRLEAARSARDLDGKKRD